MTGAFDPDAAEPDAAMDEAGSGEVDRSKDLIPSKYSAEGLTFVVPDGGTESANFDLESE